MTYSINRNGSALELALEGRLDTVTAPDLEKALTPIPEGVNTLVYDFSKLEYISSAGLRVVLRAHRGLPMGGKTKVLNCNPVVKEVFSVTGFSDIVEFE
ncbi:MAG: STAS domain-containing protein [Clostridia bacterium]|nr:STAS domain-containing protein [Clostridia bacterium]